MVQLSILKKNIHSVMTFMDRIIEWDFSATYRSKGVKKWLVWNI